MVSQTNETYNGWANYETWNIALWLGSDASYYQMLREFCYENRTSPGFWEIAHKNPGLWDSYAVFVTRNVGCLSDETPDGVSWTDSKLNHQELDRMIKEMADDDFAGGGD